MDGRARAGTHGDDAASERRVGDSLAGAARRSRRRVAGYLPAGLILTACAAIKSGAGSAYEAILPDTFYVEAAQTPERWDLQEDYLYAAGFSWTLAPQPVRVVEDNRNAWDAREWAWVQAATDDEPEQATVAPPDGFAVEKTADGGWNVKVPAAVLLAALAALGGGYAIRRRNQPEPEDPDETP